MSDAHDVVNADETADDDATGERDVTAGMFACARSDLSCKPTSPKLKTFHAEFSLLQSSRLVTTVGYLRMH